MTPDQEKELIQELADALGWQVGPDCEWINNQLTVDDGFDNPLTNNDLMAYLMVNFDVTVTRCMPVDYSLGYLPKTDPPQGWAGWAFSASPMTKRLALYATPNLAVIHAVMALKRSDK